MTRRGVFITLEGPEGSGKSTQSVLLCDYLKKRGLSVVHTREPGGTSIAEAIRRVLLHPESVIAPMTELLLYEASRSQHIAEIVRPALEHGKIVVCERYTDATVAYQGYGRRLPLTDIHSLNRIATGGLKPDLTLFLDVPVKTGLSKARAMQKKLGRGRAGSKNNVSVAGDRLERENIDFHLRVRRGYYTLTRQDPRRIKLIPWRTGIEKTHGRLITEVERYLRTRKI
ncbi:MAG TPA: dTMP kinase [Elusimicrobiota bacterium]|nr:dTMP kinase [Elusimicrobiota bacterium]